MNSMMLLRAGMVAQLLGSILLSTSLVFVIISPETLSQYWSNALAKIEKYLRRLLTTSFYKSLRLRKDKPEDSVFKLFMYSYPSLGILLIIAILGAITSSLATSIHNVWSIVIAAPFLVFAGFIGARTVQNKVLRIVAFLVFAFISPLIYGVLILGALFNVILLSLVVIFVLLHSWAKSQDVQKVMAVFGGFFLVVGTALQFGSTFIRP